MQQRNQRIAIGGVLKPAKRTSTQLLSLRIAFGNGREQNRHTRFTRLFGFQKRTVRRRRRQ